MKLPRLAVFVLVVFALALTQASAQSVDAFFGLNWVKATAPTSGTSFGYPTDTIGNGVFPSVGGDIIFFHGMGIGGEVAWRGKTGTFQGYTFRPIFYDFNLIDQPFSLPRLVPELQAGIGGESLRFYTGQYNCSYTSCTNYVSSNHFLFHLGAGVKFYATSHIFVRPEAHVYFVRNNSDFADGVIKRFGVAIGYTFSATNP